ncbi:bifunctional riboflavin kinase/FAD synthetase [Campylobacter sp. VicNov18]|uniref:bifunctional riboflavin kinase/FAD synthetase n=1 Tax=Campylobacter bilis TaxID=2691918 RepID=UPI00130DA4DA|nr:bifunctional riboflavin kinase/FAD synthetase [Campylobacter bilis]MPV63395.1 bifunctional riboflavin kinase/FAD synthetase [Campylobacter hepaticus]MBM0636894.1 bifunctional riboflavin kinase/FAD synthetase [Campylobacter bilis]MCC8277603.1 bifunctional riboflavin kinase/FAD synthetase [Campylobacter bilis]MCC8299212.1 bifunctional riboflavin kinase/FAD synthetase [Campylobacter bilis]MCC8300512.1 bifunctional riboflavin kinase/FAD synthetase [Campylobacter bilis]
MLNIFTTISKNDVTSLALGCFDGMHLGHLKLVESLDENGALLVINKLKGKMLCSNEQKKELAKKPVIEVDFESIKSLEGKEFLDCLKKQFIHLKFIVVGYDFSFGRNKAYRATDIKSLSSIKTLIVDKFSIDGVGVHASLIKDFLAKANLQKAREFLGRNYSIKAKVVKGQGLGSKALFATVNLECEDYFLPFHGVYASLLKGKNKIYKSVSFLGIRSSDGNFAIESHILENYEDGFNQGDVLELEFVDFIRENQKFQDLKKLKQQIAKDIKQAQKLLRKNDER